MSITFDGPNKLISLSAGTTSLNIINLWSRWVDWLLTGDNGKFLPAFKQVGADPIDAIAGTSIPVYIFLQNGWRIRPQEASHTLNVSGGILLVDGGGDPFVNTIGSFNIRINYSQPVQAITTTIFTGGSGLSMTQDEALTEALAAAQQAELQATIARKMQTNKAVVSADGLSVHIYDDDGVTLLRSFSISADKNTRLPV